MQISNQFHFSFGRWIRLWKSFLLFACTPKNVESVCVWHISCRVCVSLFVSLCKWRMAGGWQYACHTHRGENSTPPCASVRVCVWNGIVRSIWTYTVLQKIIWKIIVWQSVCMWSGVVNVSQNVKAHFVGKFMDEK